MKLPAASKVLAFLGMFHLIAPVSLAEIDTATHDIQNAKKKLGMLQNEVLDITRLFNLLMQEPVGAPDDVKQRYNEYASRLIGKFEALTNQCNVFEGLIKVAEEKHSALSGDPTSSSASMDTSELKAIKFNDYESIYYAGTNTHNLYEEIVGFTSETNPNRSSAVRSWAAVEQWISDLKANGLITANAVTSYSGTNSTISLAALAGSYEGMQEFSDPTRKITATLVLNADGSAHYTHTGSGPFAAVADGLFITTSDGIWKLDGTRVLFTGKNYSLKGYVRGPNGELVEAQTQVGDPYTHDAPNSEELDYSLTFVVDKDGGGLVELKHGKSWLHLVKK